MGSTSSRPPPDWVVPPTAPFLKEPVELGPYFLLASLGKGAFGEVLLAVRKRDAGEVKSPTCEQLYRSKAPKLVVKRFDNALLAEQENEAATHVKAELGAPHKNILLFDRHFGDQDKKAVALVFEYCNAGDLRRLVKKCQERKQQMSMFEVLTIASQLSDALCALKKAKIMHGDVALRNVFLSWNPESGELCAKLGDFGLCRDLGDTKSVTGRTRSSVHLAPEIKDDASPYDERADVYSFGVVLYELMASVVVYIPTALFKLGADLNAERDAIDTKLLDKTTQDRYSSLCTLVSSMLNRNPAKRPPIEDVSKQLGVILSSLTAKERVLSPLISQQVSVDIARCSATVPTFIDADAVAEVTVNLFDTLGQPLFLSDAAVSASVDSFFSKSPIEPLVKDNRNGKFSVTFETKWATELTRRFKGYVLSVSVNGLPIPGSPFSMPVRGYSFMIQGLGVSDSGALYSTTHHHVLNSELAKLWGGPGSGPAHLADGRGICLTPTDEVLVCDFENNRVQCFSARSAPRAFEVPAPTAIAYCKRTRRAFVVHDGPRRTVISAFSSPDFKQRAQWDCEARGVAIDSDALVYASTPAGVSVFNADGKLVRSWELAGASGIAIGGDLLFACDTSGFRVRVFTLDGKAVRDVPFKVNDRGPRFVAASANGKTLHISNSSDPTESVVRDFSAPLSFRESDSSAGVAIRAPLQRQYTGADFSHTPLRTYGGTLRGASAVDDFAWGYGPLLDASTKSVVVERKTSASGPELAKVPDLEPGGDLLAFVGHMEQSVGVPIRAPAPLQRQYTGADFSHASLRTYGGTLRGASADRGAGWGYGSPRAHYWSIGQYGAGLGLSSVL